MLENFTLVASLGCSHTAEDEQTPSEQNVSVEVPQRNTKKTDLSSQKVCPWEMGNLALEGGLCGPEVLRTNPGQTPCGTDVKSHQHGGETLMRRDLGLSYSASLVLRLDVHRSWGASPLAKSTGHENKEVFPRRLWTNDGSGQRHFRSSGRCVGGPSGIYRRVVLAPLRAGGELLVAGRLRSNAVAPPSPGTCRSSLGTREGSDRRPPGAALLTEKNLNQAVGPQAPDFPLADPTSLTSWSHVLHKQVKLKMMLAHLTNLRRLAGPQAGLGEFLF
ncbi:hypothetical protein R6Z07M_013802 [Ovis aries]